MNALIQDADSEGRLYSITTTRTVSISEMRKATEVVRLYSCGEIGKQRHLKGQIWEKTWRSQHGMWNNT